MPTEIKRSNEVRIYEFSLAAHPEIAKSGMTITSVMSIAVTPVTVPPLVVGSPTISGGKFQAQVSGGLAGSRYLIDATVQLSDGVTILRGDNFVISVVDPALPSA